MLLKHWVLNSLQQLGASCHDFVSGWAHSDLKCDHLVDHCHCHHPLQSVLIRTSLTSQVLLSLKCISTGRQDLISY